MLTCRSRCLPPRILSRPFSTSFPNDLFEDLPPPASEPPHDEPIMEKKRFYIPPPLTDEELLQIRSVSEWPKSRVIWAMGRFGYLESKLGYKPDRVVFDTLSTRLGELVDQMNTRDLVRALQSIAYSSSQPISLINRIRKKFSLSVDSVNDLFLVSFVYANLKLVNRNDWTISPTCKSTLQFILSEMVHRKHKILCSNWLEICAALLTSKETVRVPLTDSIDIMVQHAFTFALKHVKDAKVISKFSQSLFGYSANYEAINNVLGFKFAKGWKTGSDALDVGFFFFVNNLVSPGNVEKWLTAARTAIEPLKLDSEGWAKLYLVSWTIERENLVVSNDTMRWLKTTLESMGSPDCSNLSLIYSPIVTADSVHVNKVLVRMANSTVHYNSEFVGPFFCPVVLHGSKTVVEWDKPWELEPPYRRGWSMKLAEMRRKFLLESGYIVLRLDRKDWSAKSEEEKLTMNEKFRELLTSNGSVMVKRGDSSIEEGRLVPQVVLEDEKVERVRRESKRLENMLRAKRKTITRQVRRKIQKRIRK
jgi:hypothetical protein